MTSIVVDTSTPNRGQRPQYTHLAGTGPLLTHRGNFSRMASLISSLTILPGGAGTAKRVRRSGTLAATSPSRAAERQVTAHPGDHACINGRMQQREDCRHAVRLLLVLASPFCADGCMTDRVFRKPANSVSVVYAEVLRS